MRDPTAATGRRPPDRPLGVAFGGPLAVDHRDFHGIFEPTDRPTGDSAGRRLPARFPRTPPTIRPLSARLPPAPPRSIARSIQKKLIERNEKCAIQRPNGRSNGRLHFRSFRPLPAHFSGRRPPSRRRLLAHTRRGALKKAFRPRSTLGPAARSSRIPHSCAFQLIETDPFRRLRAVARSFRSLSVRSVHSARSTIDPTPVRRR